MLFASAATSATALAAFEPSDTSWEGLSGLVELARAELGPEHVRVATTLDWKALSPADSLLLVHPTHVVDPDEAAAFMRAGGRLAVIDDRGTGERLLRSFHVDRRPLPKFPERYVHDNRALAVASPAVEALGGVHPTVVDVNAVVLNHATGFVHPDLTTVLEVRGSDDHEAGDATTVAVAVAGQVEKGRLFAVGDPSAFMNLMLRFPGNRAFASGILRYLSEGAGVARRGGHLVILVNDFDEANSFTGAAPFRKELERTLRTIAVGVENLRDEGFPGWLHALVAALCGLMLAAWALRSSIRLYAPRLPRFARAVPLAAQGGVAGRLAVLAAPGAAPELALLELRSALVETLSLRLSCPEPTPLPELLVLAERRGILPSRLVARCLDWAERARAAEETVLRGTRSAASRGDVLAAARLVDEVTAAVHLATDHGARPS